uniref:Uncharacterized protein n=1 Tax=Setaria digitata TaxID=48799 RepID=A0A915Q0D5_9BILA
MIVPLLLSPLAVGVTSLEMLLCWEFVPQLLPMLAEDATVLGVCSAAASIAC